MAFQPLNDSSTAGVINRADIIVIFLDFSVRLILALL